MTRKVEIKSALRPSSIFQGFSLSDEAVFEVADNYCRLFYGGNKMMPALEHLREVENNKICITKALHRGCLD